MKYEKRKRQISMIRFLGRKLLKQNILVKSGKQATYKNVTILYDSFFNKGQFFVIRKTNFQIFKFGIKNKLLNIFRIFQLFQSFQLFGLKTPPPFWCFFIYTGILTPINSFVEFLSFNPLLNRARLGEKGIYKYNRSSLSKNENELTNSGITFHENYYWLRQSRKLNTSKIVSGHLIDTPSCHILLNLEVKKDFCKLKNSTSLRKLIQLID